MSENKGYTDRKILTNSLPFNHQLEINAHECFTFFKSTS